MRVPKFIIPLVVLVALTAGYAFRTSLDRPTLVRTFAERTGAQATFVVDGVRCRGTAALFCSLFEDTPGILKIEAFASERTAVVTFDSKAVTPKRIQEIMEAPIAFDDGTTNQVFRCVSVR